MKKYLLLSLAFATACGGSSVSIDDFIKDYVKAKCEYEVKCGSQPDQATCEKSFQLNDSQTLTIISGVKMGQIGYDGDKAGDCFDYQKDQTCNFDGLQPTGDNPCQDIFTGKVPMGGACVESLECAGQAPCNATDPNCDDSMMCCPGTCGAPAPAEVASGGSCGENDTCVAGTYCKPPASGTGNGTCTAVLTMDGAACDDFYACANPMICDLFADAPTCETPAPTDGACDPNDIIPCADQRQHCDDATMKCVNGLANGAACMSSGDCLPDSHCVSMVCTADAGAGGTCSDSGVRCLGGLDCTNGTCTLPPAGMSCL